MNHKREDSAVTLDTSGIEIEQHDGLWHTADVREIKDEIFYLMKIFPYLSFFLMYAKISRYDTMEVK